MGYSVSRTIPDETLSRIIQIESGGRPTIKAPTSTATGLGQFINATWLATVKKHRPDLMKGRTDAQVLELRKDPVIMIEMLARFTEENAESLGAGYTDGDLYLAHFAGVGVARRLIRGDQTAQSALYFSPAAVRANRSILEGKTVGEVRAWANRKMAAAGKTNWVAKYWPGKPAQPPRPPPDVEPVPPKADHALVRLLKFIFKRRGS